MPNTLYTARADVNGNILLNQSGKGIDFSATANSSGTMTSELLDDYEEGTWTPVPTSTGATFTANAVGQYTKIGNVVYISGFVDNSLAPTGTLSNAMTITGLPFTSSSGIGYGCSIALGFVVAIDYPATAKQITAIVPANSTAITLQFSVDDGSIISLTAENFDYTDARIGFAGFYFV